MAVVLALAFAAGGCTQKLGIFTIFGGFLLGIPETALCGSLARAGLTIRASIFPTDLFQLHSLRTNILGLDSMSDWTWCGIILTAAVLSKIIPVYFAARASGIASRDAAMLGVLMNTARQPP
jgi:Kef-type K+ transport system membrane component KefB